MLYFRDRVTFVAALAAIASVSGSGPLNNNKAPTTVRNHEEGKDVRTVQQRCPRVFATTCYLRMDLRCGEDGQGRGLEGKTRVKWFVSSVLIRRVFVSLLEVCCFFGVFKYR